MADIGMYYPDVFVQDETWLKAATLYWPKLARLMPTDYPRRDSPTAQVLANELDFFIDIDPAPYALRVSISFDRWLGVRELLSELTAERTRSTASGLSEAEALHGRRPSIQVPGTPLDLPYRWIHAPASVPTNYAQKLVDRGIAVLATDDEGRRWVRMERRLAQIYVTALAHSVAAKNDMPLITDQQGLPDYPQGLGHLLALPLRGDPETTMYAVLALNAVLPADLGTIPVERIVRARRVLADEFDAFLQHLNTVSESFANLSGSEDTAVLNARLELAVDRDFRAALRELERGLRSQGLEPVRSLFSLKTPEVPIVLSVLGTTFVGGGGLPKTLLDVGAVAACFVSSTIRARADRYSLRHSPAGYLLGLREELNPHGLIDRIRCAERRLF